MAQELTCKNKHIMFKSFGEDFLLHQRLEAPVLNPRASACYTAIQDLESKHLLNNFLYSNDFPKQFERFAASIVYSTTFGMRIITGEEWQLQTSHKCLKNFTLAGQVGAWIVDIFPFLNNLPAPLTPWKKTAEAWYTMWENLHMTNMHDALQRPGWNWTKELNASKEVNNLSDSEIAWDLGILCDAGVETTNVQLQIFVLACLAYSDCLGFPTFKPWWKKTSAGGTSSRPEFRMLPLKRTATEVTSSRKGPLLYPSSPQCAKTNTHSTPLRNSDLNVGSASPSPAISATVDASVLAASLHGTRWRLRWRGCYGRSTSATRTAKRLL